VYAAQCEALYGNNKHTNIEQRNCAKCLGRFLVCKDCVTRLRNLNVNKGRELEHNNLISGIGMLQGVCNVEAHLCYVSVHCGVSSETLENKAPALLCKVVGRCRCPIRLSSSRRSLPAWVETAQQLSAARSVGRRTIRSGSYRYRMRKGMCYR
jgi:hypothetical protein